MSRARAYDKPPLSLTDQVALLASRGLLIPDPAEAEAFLRHNNYYRFSAYTFWFERNAAGHLRDHQFEPGTTFQQVRTLYEFDAKLRALTLEALAEIENSLKTSLCRLAADKYGSHWYELPGLRRNACAHHARIWNRKFPVRPRTPKRPPPYFRPNGQQFYHFAQLIRFLLEVQDRHYQWTQRLASLLLPLADDQLVAMGFQTPVHEEDLFV